MTKALEDSYTVEQVHVIGFAFDNMLNLFRYADILAVERLESFVKGRIGWLVGCDKLCLLLLNFDNFVRNTCRLCLMCVRGARIP